VAERVCFSAASAASRTLSAASEEKLQSQDDVVTAYLKERNENNNIEHKGYCHSLFTWFYFTY